MDNAGKVTQLLRRASGGDLDAENEVCGLVYIELKAIAARVKNKRFSDLSCDTTELANNVFLTLIRDRDVDWETRRKFFGYAATQIMRVLVDHARRLDTRRRREAMPLDESRGPQDQAATPADPLIEEELRLSREKEILMLDAALPWLREEHPDLAETVILYYCITGETSRETQSEHAGGTRVTVDQLCDEVLHINRGTFFRRLKKARILLADWFQQHKVEFD